MALTTGNKYTPLIKTGTTASAARPTRRESDALGIRSEEGSNDIPGGDDEDDAGVVPMTILGHYSDTMTLSGPQLALTCYPSQARDNEAKEACENMCQSPPTCDLPPPLPLHTVWWPMSKTVAATENEDKTCFNT